MRLTYEFHELSRSKRGFYVPPSRTVRIGFNYSMTTQKLELSVMSYLTCSPTLITDKDHDSNSSKVGNATCMGEILDGRKGYAGDQE